AAVAGLPRAVVRIPVHGLDLEATAALVKRIMGDDFTADLADVVQARTAGNPFFVTEVARLHAIRGERGRIDVPPGVHQVLTRRVARLSQPASEVLGIAALIGEPDVGLLAKVTGQTEDKVLTLL